ncbi:MAG: AAA family ATPase [Oscillospiraceae bacterium]|nr:AAA family ATPase [Oscillospiraceae bacterium]
MNIKQAKEQIRNTLRAYLSRDSLGNYRIPTVRQRPVLLIGPPGIGKTQIMEQIAAEENVGLVSYTITHHTRQSAIGLPFIEKRNYDGMEHTVTEYTMSEILGSVYGLMEKTGLREGILFLDEINCVSETLAPMMLQFLQCKTFGNQKLPEGWLIVAAGNPPEYNRSVRDFDVVTLDRVKRITVEEDFPVWKEYALRKGLHGAVISYLDLKKDNFYRIENSPEGMQFATARGWEDLSEILFAYEALGIAPDTELAVQYVQMPSIARDFTNYYALYNRYRQVYHIDDILRGQVPKVTVSEFAAAPFDEKLAVMGLLLSRLSEAARETRRQDALTAALHDAALAARGRLPEPPEASLREIAAERRAALRCADQAGQEDREKKLLRQTEIRRLEEYIGQLDGSLDSEEQMDALRSLFAGDTALRERLADGTGRMFDNAFRFLEAAVGPSQELVLFVSEITAGYDTSWYVGEFGCDAYFRHNRDLLLDMTRQNILDRLADRNGAETPAP